MFKKKYKSPPEDFVRWVNASIFFLRHNLGYADIRTLKRTVLSSNEVFPFSPSSEDFYDDLFEKVKELMDVSDRGCRLLVETNGVDNIMLDAGSSTRTPAGTFASSRHDAEIVLTVNRYTDIENVLATLSHELSHYKIHRLRNYVPDEMDEPLTDLSAIFHGFGIFILNSSYKQKRGLFGSSVYSQQGYLTQAQTCYVIAKMMHLNMEDLNQIKPHISRTHFTAIKNHYDQMRTKESMIPSSFRL